MAPLAAAEPAVAAFSDGQALAALIATESFLLATISLAVTLGQPYQPKQRRFVMKPPAIAMTAAVLVGIVGIAALAAWLKIYGGGHVRPFLDVVVAFGILAALAVQPVLAVMVALGARFKKKPTDG